MIKQVRGAALRVDPDDFRAKFEGYNGRNAELWRVALETFIGQYFEARNVVSGLKRTFGNRIHVDLLLENIDGSDRLLQVNVDQIGSYIPETYDSQTLRQMLGPTQTSTP